MSGRLLVEKRISVPQESDVASPGEGRGCPAARGTRRSAGRSVTVNMAESPLGWLKARGHISARQFDAGEQLRAEWERAQLSPSVTTRWDQMPAATKAAPPPLDATDAQLAAKRRFEAAVAATGSGLGDILWRVVCAGEGMREAEAALGWPARAGKLVLRLALDRLADHYGMR